MAEELLVVLNRSENSGFGFSLLNKPGLPHIIFDIVEDSPAAESGEVEVGDVILKVNETDVNRFSTKEDPKIKACIRRQLSSGAGDTSIRDMPVQVVGNGRGAYTGSVYNNSRPEPALHRPTIAHTNGSYSELEALLPENECHPESADRLQWEPLSAVNPKPKGPPKFEAYMMTGEHILNLSRTPQSSILPKHQKKIDSLRYYNNHTHYHKNHHNSVPNSPNEMEMSHRTHHCKSGTNSANTSPVGAKRDSNPSPIAESAKTPTGSFGYHGTGNFVRTSRSEDHLQVQQDSNMSAVDIEIEEDVTSSLNTLLDTRPDNDSSSTHNTPPPGPKTDRIVWTYNAPVTSPSASEHNSCCQTMSNGSSSHSTSPTSSSPLRSMSPASPTSMSSSVMSSHSGSRRMPSAALTNGPHHHNGDLSMSEAISNISSPDFHDEESMDILNTRDCVMEISDHSDSDSTLLVSEPQQQQKRLKNGNNSSSANSNADSDHRIVIQVKGPDKDSGNTSGLSPRSEKPTTNRRSSDGRRHSGGIPEMHGYQELRDVDDDLPGEDGFSTRTGDLNASSPPPLSEDDSDIDSLHSFHYSPKAVDLPSAIRLAKRLYSLDGFKKSDVSRHLSKNNDFSRAVAEEYLKYFDFDSDTLDVALRKFLKQFSLTGETQERERVLVHFSKRYLDCNPGSFNSQDAVHTLTCAIMLLNTDLHGQNIGRKMTCTEFIENLAGLNECENFPREVLKHLYQAIKSYPLEWALDEETDECTSQVQQKQYETSNIVGNPFLDVPNTDSAIEYKKGYVMRKCCYEANAKRTPFHKRSWKMFYCTLRDLVLYLHKDEHGFRKNQMSDNLHNAIRIHHALATKAQDYTKKQYVFRLQTADQAEYLFQTSDPKELQSWIDTINFVCASFSAQPLEAAVGSQKKFQRPLLPCSHTKLNLREQLRDHEERVLRLEAELEEHRKSPPERGAKSLVTQNYKEKEVYLNFELKRYRTYAYLLRSRMSQYCDNRIELEPSLVVETAIGELEEATGSVSLLDGIAGGIVPPPVPDRRSPPTATNRSTSEL